MTARPVLFLGGPWHERVVELPADRWDWKVPIPAPAVWAYDGPEVPTEPAAYEVAEYRRERLAWRDPTSLDPPGYAVGEVMVADDAARAYALEVCRILGDLARLRWTFKALPVCSCPEGGWWQCIDGLVYGPCSSELCGGVCEPEGSCGCPLHEHLEGHDTITPGRPSQPAPPRSRAARPADREAARAWSDLMDQVLAGEISLDEAHRRAP